VRRQPNPEHSPEPCLTWDTAPALLSDRVIEYLCKREMKEPEICYKDEYRQARICVALAYKGEPDPFTAASYQIYGVHPSTMWQRILAARKAMLAWEFDLWYDAAGNMRPDVPKKTSLPVTVHPDEQVPARLAAVLKFPEREAA